MANSKEDRYLDVAENLFVYQAKTREEIAKQLKLSDKTVRVWAKKYNWEEKKAALMECKRSSHLELYELVRLMTQAMSEDAKSKKEISPQRIHALNGLVVTVSGLKKYEGEIQVEREKEERGAQVSDSAALVEKVHDILGIR